MENHDNLVSSDQTDGKEYQIPELVDLNTIDGAQCAPYNCNPGSGAFACGTGGSAEIQLKLAYILPI